MFNVKHTDKEQIKFYTPGVNIDLDIDDLKCACLIAKHVDRHTSHLKSPVFHTVLK